MLNGHTLGIYTDQFLRAMEDWSSVMEQLKNHSKFMDVSWCFKGKTERIRWISTMGFLFRRGRGTPEPGMSTIAGDWIGNEDTM